MDSLSYVQNHLFSSENQKFTKKLFLKGKIHSIREFKIS